MIMLVAISKKTKDGLKKKNIHVLRWPYLSTDLNLQENVLGVVSKEVYDLGKQYNSFTESKTTILFHCNEYL